MINLSQDSILDTLTTSTQESGFESIPGDVNTSSVDISANFNNKSFKSGLKNLSYNFDSCERESLSDTHSSFSLADTVMTTSLSTSGNGDSLADDTKISNSSGSNANSDWKPTYYSSATVEEAKTMQWPEAYKHRCHDI